MKEREEKIVCGALQMFTRLGVKSVTMDDVSREMGMSKKTLYNFFRNKKDLVKKSFGFLFDGLRERIDELGDRDMNPIEELLAVDQVVYDMVKENAPDVTFQLQKYYPEVWSEIEDLQNEKFLPYVMENLNRGIKEGWYRDDIDVDIIAQLYFSNPHAVRGGDLREKPLKTIFEQSLAYHIRGIATPKGIEFYQSKIMEYDQTH
jgi:AcrR family transcriptional regulator